MPTQQRPWIGREHHPANARNDRGQADRHGIKDQGRPLLIGDAIEHIGELHADQDKDEALSRKMNMSQKSRLSMRVGADVSRK